MVELAIFVSPTPNPIKSLARIDRSRIIHQEIFAVASYQRQANPVGVRQGVLVFQPIDPAALRWQRKTEARRRELCARDWRQGRWWPFAPQTVTVPSLRGAIEEELPAPTPATFVKPEGTLVWPS